MGAVGGIAGAAVDAAGGVVGAAAGAAGGVAVCISVGPADIVVAAGGEGVYATAPNG